MEAFYRLALLSGGLRWCDILAHFLSLAWILLRAGAPNFIATDLQQLSTLPIATDLQQLFWIYLPRWHGSCYVRALRRAQIKGRQLLQSICNSGLSRADCKALLRNVTKKKAKLNNSGLLLANRTFSRVFVLYWDRYYDCSCWTGRRLDPPHSWNRYSGARRVD